MAKFICFFIVLIGFCASGFCQVPTGTRQRSTNDTLIKKTVPAGDKYNKKATKWPKRDSLKNNSCKKGYHKADSSQTKEIKASKKLTHPVMVT